MDNPEELRQIWSKGSGNRKHNLSPQKMNEIMSRESESLIDKINKTAQADQRALPFVAILVVGALAWSGFYSFAVFLTGVYALLYLYNERMLKRLGQVELKDDVLAYLTGFRRMTATMIRHYTWVIGLATLLIGVPMILFSVEVAGIPTDKFMSPENRQANLAILAFCTLLFSGICMLGYRLSVRVLYGQKLRKIDEMIADLSEEV